MSKESYTSKASRYYRTKGFQNPNEAHEFMAYKQEEGYDTEMTITTFDGEPFYSVALFHRKAPEPAPEVRRRPTILPRTGRVGIHDMTQSEIDMWQHNRENTRRLTGIKRKAEEERRGQEGKRSKQDWNAREGGWDYTALYNLADAFTSSEEEDSVQSQPNSQDEAAYKELMKGYTPVIHPPEPSRESIAFDKQKDKELYRRIPVPGKAVPGTVTTKGFGFSGVTDARKPMANKPNGRPLSYGEWLKTLSPEERDKKIEAMAAKRDKELNGKRKRGGVGKKKYYKRKYTARGRYKSGGGGGNNIIYPNVVGRGAYGLRGGISWGRPDSYFRGNLSGYYGDVSGLGAYNIKANTLMGLIDLGQSPPVVRNTNRGEATIINHREYLGDLVTGSGSPTVFDLNTFQLNPGNGNLFPFLANIAQKFQEYEIRGMLVELKTLSSDYATNMSLGSMFAAADYNALNNAPVSKLQLENMEYASSVKPSSSLIMPIECDPRNAAQTHLYIATDNNYNGGDKRLFDLCDIYLGSQGCPAANTPIAEIWLTYEVALYKPIILIDTLPGSQAISWKILQSGITNGNPIGSGFFVAPGSDPRFDVGPGAGTITLPQVRTNFSITFQYGLGTPPILAQFPTVTFGADIKVWEKEWSSPTGNGTRDTAFGYDTALDTASEMVITYLVQVFQLTGQSYMFIANDGDFGVGTNYGDIFITSVNPSISLGLLP